MTALGMYLMLQEQQERHERIHKPRREAIAKAKAEQCERRLQERREGTPQTIRAVLDKPSVTADELFSIRKDLFAHFREHTNVGLWLEDPKCTVYDYEHIMEGLEHSAELLGYISWKECTKERIIHFQLRHETEEPSMDLERALDIGGIRVLWPKNRNSSETWRILFEAAIHHKAGKIHQKFADFKHALVAYTEYGQGGFVDHAGHMEVKFHWADEVKAEIVKTLREDRRNVQEMARIVRGDLGRADSNSWCLAREIDCVWEEKLWNEFEHKLHRQLRGVLAYRVALAVDWETYIQEKKPQTF